MLLGLREHGIIPVSLHVDDHLMINANVNNLPWTSTLDLGALYFVWLNSHDSVCYRRDGVTNTTRMHLYSFITTASREITLSTRHDKLTQSCHILL
jgi:hypothetical protein